MEVTAGTAGGLHRSLGSVYTSLVVSLLAQVNSDALGSRKQKTHVDLNISTYTEKVSRTFLNINIK